MIYQEARDKVLTLVNEAATGYVTDATFLTFWDSAQIEHFNFLEGKLTDMRAHDPTANVNDADVKDIDNRLQPFVELETVVLTSGYGDLPPITSGRWSAPRSVTSSAYRKKCGEHSTPADKRYPVKWVAPTEFANKTSSGFPPQVDTPMYRLRPKGRIQVSPLDIYAVEVEYFTQPTSPLSLAETIPWGEKDIKAIMDIVITQIGTRYSAPELTHFGTYNTNNRT